MVQSRSKHTEGEDTDVKACNILNNNRKCYAELSSTVSIQAYVSHSKSADSTVLSCEGNV